MNRSRLPALAVAVVLLPGLAACGESAASGSGDDGGDIVVASTLPLSGPIGPLGPQVQAGYEQAVQDVNAAGGLEVGGERRRVRLITLDNRSDPNTASEQAREFVTRDGAHALLGAVTPQISVPAALVAEQQRVPYVTSLTPIRAFAGANEAGWRYSYDLYFDEAAIAQVPFDVSDLTQTNRRVALLVDNSLDGQTQQPLYEQAAEDSGYEVVAQAVMPVGTTNFARFVDEAKAADADVMVTSMSPPDGIALWKQMKALGYAPQVAVCQKCGASLGWGDALGALAEGTTIGAYWSPEAGLPLTDQLVETLGDDYPNNADLSLAVGAYSAAQVLFDAMTAAGSTDPDEVADALAETDKTYPIGPVRFEDNHTAATPTLGSQWQDGNTRQVFPAEGAVPLIAPIRGLQ